MFERLVIAAAIALLGAGAFAAFRHFHLRRASKAAPATGRPVLLYFRSDTCAPCAAQARYIQQLQVAYGERILVQTVDADKDHATAQQYGVFTLPTTLVVDGTGTVRHANYGLADTRKLAAQVLSIAPRDAQLAANSANFTN